MPTYTTPPAEEDIRAMAEAAFAALPENLAAQVRNVAVIIEDIADDETLAAMGIEDPWSLTGLYRGIPLPERSVMDIAPMPDTVTLFREPILIEWIETGEDLPRLVASVLVHELAHHVGFSDAEIEAIEDAMGHTPPI
jgi:acetylglutamate kinase